MTEPQKFPYSTSESITTGDLPFIPVALLLGDRWKEVNALVDSGATVNVLPYDIGLELGLAWEEQDFALDLVGLLRGSPAFGVVCSVEIGSFAPVRLAFAWTRKTSQEVPAILGQINFFQEFRVSFDGRAQTPEIARYPLTLNP